MTRRNTIYLFLVGFFAFGIIIDWVVWNGLPPSWTWNDITQLIGVIVLCLMWEDADARTQEVPHKRSAIILTILLPPLGTAVYFFQSRRWPQAILGTILFWAGINAAAFAVDEVCYRLLT